MLNFMSTTLEKGVLIVVGAVIAFLLIRMFLIILFLLITPAGEIHRKGVELGQRGDWAAAIVEFDRVIEMKPHHEKAYTTRAFAKSQLGDHKGAKEDTRIALRKNPYYGQAYAVLGLAELQSGNKKIGCEKLQEAYDLGYLEAKYYLSEYCN
jgi:tetratricopeptide (TPR) repeat protein